MWNRGQGFFFLDSNAKVAYIPCWFETWLSYFFKIKYQFQIICLRLPLSFFLFYLYKWDFFTSFNFPFYFPIFFYFVLVQINDTKINIRVCSICVHLHIHYAVKRRCSLTFHSWVMTDIIRKLENSTFRFIKTISTQSQIFK